VTSSGGEAKYLSDCPRTYVRICPHDLPRSILNGLSEEYLFRERIQQLVLTTPISISELEYKYMAKI